MRMVQHPNLTSKNAEKGTNERHLPIVGTVVKVYMGRFFLFLSSCFEGSATVFLLVSL